MRSGCETVLGRVIACALFPSLLVCPAAGAGTEPARPNIVLILADDLGFTDTAPYGSEIDTPTISALADEGIRFSNYHTAVSCAPSRAMLLTGVDSHLAGIGPGFASAAASPLAYYKFYAGEGGLRVPLIIAGEPLNTARTISDAFAWVTDISPTILALTGAKRPGARYGGRVVEPMIGRSLVPLIEGRVDRVHGPEEPIGYELGGNAALFQGDYKIVLNRGPVGDGEWHLYDIAKDPGETRDLAAAQPQQLQQMLSNYRDYARRNGVLPVPRDFDAQRQVAINGLRERGGAPLLIGILLVLTLLPFHLAQLSSR